MNFSQDYRPEDEKEARTLFYAMFDMVKRMVKKQIQDHKDKREWRDESLMIFGFGQLSLVIQQPMNYTKVMMFNNDGGEGKEMSAYMLGHHDSCWDNGVDTFFEVLTARVKKYEEMKRLCGDDHEARKAVPRLEYISMRVKKIRDEKMHTMINSLDYEMSGNDYRKEEHNLPYDDFFFPWL